MHASKKGQTIIELLVALGIIVALTSILILYNRTGERVVRVPRSAQKLALDIRRAQNYALTVREVVPNEVPYGWGIHLEVGATQYILFADRNNNGAWDGGSEDVEVIPFEPGVQVLSSQFTDVSFRPPTASVVYNPSVGAAGREVRLSLISGPSVEFCVSVGARAGRVSAIECGKGGDVVEGWEKEDKDEKDDKDDVKDDKSDKDEKDEKDDKDDVKDEKAEGGGCFIAGTKVLMADGSYKEIQEIAAGDIVMTRNFETGAMEPEEVKKPLIHPDYPGGYLILNNRLKVTGNHRMWRVNTHTWERADALAIGDQLFAPNGELTTVYSIEKIDGRNTVYNLSLNGPNHNYFVEGMAVVHNEQKM